MLSNAEYVFVDLSAAKDAIVDDANSISDFMFLLNPTDHKTHVADDSYWQYEVLLDGKKETKFISDKLVASDDAGLLFRNVKENDKGYITKADLFNDASKRDVLTVTDKTITFNNDTVAIDATAGNADYTIASNASAKLLLLDGNPIMKDKVAKDSKVKDIKGIAGKWAFKEADVATFANPIDLTSGSDKVVAGTNYVDGFYKVTAPTAVTASGSKGAYSATVDVQYAKNGATVTVTVTTTTAATANTDTIKGQTAAALNSSLTFTYTQGAADSQATIDVTNA